MKRLAEFKNDKDRKAFETRCIETGWISAPSKGGRPKDDEDPFENIAEQVLKGQKPDEEEDDETRQVREELERINKQQAAKDAAKNSGKKPKRKSG